MRNPSHCFRIVVGALGLAALISSAASAEGETLRERRLDRKGDRIAERLERRGDRIDLRLDRRGERIDRRLDRRAGLPLIGGTAGGVSDVSE